jgi:hypothetical protein
MASRENTTLQGTIIALIIVLLIMFVVAFLLNNERNKQMAAAASATAQADEQRRAAGEAQGEANSYKQWMGFSESDTLATVEAAYKKDMEQYGATFDEADRVYSRLVANLAKENRDLAAAEANAKAEVKNLKETLLATETEKNKQIEQFSKEAQAAKAELAEERSKFNQGREAMNADKDKLSEQLAGIRQEIDRTKSDAAVATKKQQEEVVGLSRDIEILRGNQLDPDPFAQPEDGLVSWVNQAEQKVWLNLGSEDSLRPQVTFSVYSGDEADALKAELKGSIEVTKILGPHMAEARITKDKPTRPLMEGDKVYSQVWNPGRQVGFALAGVLDMDGDGKNDIEELKSVIALNNGKVDAEPGEDGAVAGEMTVDTRYLILGEFPESTVANRENQVKAWEVMTEAADRLGIETITLGEFLNLMGWKADRRTVELGRSADSGDFPADRGGDYRPPQNTTGKSNFRPRKPQPTY